MFTLPFVVTAYRLEVPVSVTLVVTARWSVPMPFAAESTTRRPPIAPSVPAMRMAPPEVMVVVPLVFRILPITTSRLLVEVTLTLASAPPKNSIAMLRCALMSWCATFLVSTRFW